MLPIAEKFNTLASLVERPPEDAGRLLLLGIDDTILDRQSGDELAAEHYDIVIHDMMPVASVFIEKDSMLGGDISQQVFTWMTAAGFDPDTTSSSADHLSNELRFLGYLGSHAQFDEASRFVHLHMAAWLPLLRSEWCRSGSKLFEELESGLGSLIEELCALAEYSGPAFGMLAPSPFDFTREKCGLADIGKYLATTPECGLHISRHRLTNLARSLRLPAGFGSRARQIEEILRSAGQYNALNLVCDFLEDEIRAVLQVWEKEKVEPVGYGATPGATYWAEQWVIKLHETQKLVSTLRQAEGN